MKMAVFGAGSIGVYLGGCLQAAGAQVLLLGRERMVGVLASHGVQVSDYRGRAQHVAAADCHLSTRAEALADADLVLVTVKSAATAQAAAELATVLKPQALVISFQNGVRNAQLLARALPEQVVLAGMVPFNVLQRGTGHFHQGSEGELEVQAHRALQPWLAVFQRAGLPLQVRHNMQAVLWGKLLLNLNNPINALSGLPLQQQLAQRDYRRCLAAAQREALQIMQAAGIEPAQVTPLPAAWLAKLLVVPDVLFRVLARRMLAIDPLARSSMWEDLQAGRVTEIDWINGEIVQLAAHCGRTAPVNARLVELIRAAEQGGKRDWSAAALWQQLSP